MAKNLVIVESPAKAKTIEKYLKADKVLKGSVIVRASMGHVRDLPKSTLGVEVNGDVTVKYLVPKDKKELIKELAAEVKKAEVLWLATDLDREGEAIAWHLKEALKAPDDMVRRVTFNEITPAALATSFSAPREIEMPLVDAQQARRVIDRFVGYRLSPVLWDAVEANRSLSAGRVQSVATRLIVDREREIDAFTAEEYFSVWATLRHDGQSFGARLVAVDGDELTFESTPRLVLTPEGEGRKTATTVSYTGAVTDRPLAEAYAADLRRAGYSVTGVKTQDRKRRPSAPFTTSTLQQEASRRLGYGARRTMGLAQRLYEGVEMPGEGQVGLITYMRTDSVNMSDTALAEIGSVIASEYTDERYYDGPRTYKTRAKGAQEAHEAVRPTSAARHPRDVRAALGGTKEGDDLARLYELVWQRAVASQMADAQLRQVTAEITAIPEGAGSASAYTLRASGQTVVFDGFLRVYAGDEEASEQDRQEQGDDDAAKATGRLPALAEGDTPDCDDVEMREHATKPPGRYTEASLVKKLEELGIGRPSTYAPTISTITDREYVLSESKRLSPTELGTKVNDFLVEHFPEYVDYAFTARMEGDLDQIADGDEDWKPAVRVFWDELERRIEKVMGGCPLCGAALEFRTGFRGRRFIACTNQPECTFRRPLGVRDGDWADKPLDETCPKCGEHHLVKKRGAFGWFIACSGYPGCDYSRPTDEEEAAQAADAALVEGRVCPDCGKPLAVKRGRYGKFIGCTGYPDCRHIERIEETTGIACPQCNEGELAQRRTKRRKIFYGCTRYPECDFVVWEKPLPVPCPSCGGLLAGAGKTVTCQSCKTKFPRDEFVVDEDEDGAAAAVPADGDTAAPADAAAQEDA